MKLNHRLYILIAFFGGSFFALSQQEPLFQHNYLNPFVYNPGYAGINDRTEIGAFRNQKWAEFNGGIVSNLINVHSRISKSNSSIGLQLNTDNIGLTSRTKVHFSYAYKIQLADNLILQPGLAFGIVDQRINFSNINANFSDPILTQVFDASKTGVDANFGLFLKYKDFNIGFSMPQLLANQLELIKGTNNIYQLSRQYILNTSYTIGFKNHKNPYLKPDLLVIHSPNLPLHYSTSLLLGMHNIGWIGATYKSDYAIGANIGLSLFDKVKIGLAYDIPLGKLATITNSNNFEVAVIYHFGNTEAQEKPESNEAKESAIENKFNDAVKQQELKDSIHSLTIDSLNTEINIKQLEIKVLEHENILIKDNTLTVISDTSKKSRNNVTINNGQNIKIEQSQVENNLIIPDDQNINEKRNQIKQFPVEDIQTQSIKIKDDFFTEVLNNTEALDGYYVVTGMYRSKKEAERLLTIAKTEFTTARILVNQRNQKYYVVLYYSKNISGVIDAIIKSNGIKEPGFSKAWALNYFKKK
jgi:type IX secretion system PorP/SprF family membrane protein